MTTKNNPAEICRENNWQVGTRLRGTEYYGNGKKQTTTITLTAIGEQNILAKAKGRSENLWTLSCREWREVK